MEELRERFTLPKVMAAFRDGTLEQRKNFDKRRGIIRRHTDGPQLLARAAETATNQAELAELLNAGYKRIYLRNGNFSVPIGKTDIYYIGIGHPNLTASFAEEQYRRAGVTFEEIELSRQSTPQPSLWRRMSSTEDTVRRWK